jgi:hypothetical protein
MKLLKALGIAEGVVVVLIAAYIGTWLVCDSHIATILALAAALTLGGSWHRAERLSCATTCIAGMVAFGHIVAVLAVVLLMTGSPVLAGLSVLAVGASTVVCWRRVRRYRRQAEQVAAEERVAADMAGVDRGLLHLCHQIEEAECG